MKHRAVTRQAASRRCTGMTILVAAIAAVGPACAAQDVDLPLKLQTVEIIGTTPLPGLALARERIPANVQTLDSAAATGAGRANLTEALNRRLGSVFVNEVQGNPCQPDISFRGFTASPLLGTPQDLSVYMDGVRVNQPFGDRRGKQFCLQCDGKLAARLTLPKFPENLR